MKRIKSLLPVLFAILWLQNAYGQKMTYIGIEQGLSNNTVTTIYKDKLGFMWFGTLDGLNRYDGYSFKVFRNKFNDVNSLPDDIINAISSDNEGNIWVGTQHGLGVLNSRSLAFSKIFYRDSLKAVKPLDTWIFDVKTGTKGEMLVASANTGFLIYTAGNEVPSTIPLRYISTKIKYTYTVNAITVLKTGEIYIVVDHVGLCLYDPKLRVVIPVSENLPVVSAIKYDGHGTIWIGTRRGLYTCNIAGRKVQKYQFKENRLNECWVTDLLVDKSNHVWATTDGFGIVDINIADIKTYSLIQQGGPGTLSSNAVYAIYEDELSRKWIGTLRGGIDVIDKGKNQFSSFVHEPFQANSLVYNFTFSFCEDKENTVWIGTDGGGISLWDRKTGSFRNNPYNTSQGESLVNEHISGIVADRNNNIWLASYGKGVYHFDNPSRKLEPVLFENIYGHNAVWRLYLDDQQDIWASSLTGLGPLNDFKRLFKYDRALNRFKPASFPVRADVLSIADDKHGGLWLGTFNGLLHFNKANGKIYETDLKTAVRALHADSTGKLWIGTYGRGLLYFDPLTAKFKTYSEDNGLCNNKVLNIEADASGNIWASTYNGISKLFPKTGRIENFYAADGLQSNQFYYNASAKLQNGQILFGGIKGFSIFSPDSIRQVHDFPALTVTGLRIDNVATTARDGFIRDGKSIYTTNNIVVPYEKAILSVDYVALEYSQPQKIQYAYKLSGRDKAWNYAGNSRNINYSRLAEGKYVLEIRSTNASGIWNSTERAIYITVLPPWYRTWWAFTCYFALAGFIIYAYLYYHRKQTRLEYEVKFTNELNEKKISFFTNISHELRTPLTLIVNPIKDLLQSNGANIDLIDVSSIYRNSRRLLSLVDQLLLFRKSESETAALTQTWINLREVCYEVFLCFNNQVKARNLNYSFECNETETLAYADREKLEIVLFNLLSNAIKYTPDSGSVSLQIGREKGFWSVYVKDTGSGIAEETGEKLFEKFYRANYDGKANEQSGFGIGLFLAKKYMVIQNGNLTYTSQPGLGSVFKMLLPVMDKPFEVPVTVEAKSSFSLLHELIADSTDVLQPVIIPEDNHVANVLGDLVNKKPVILLIDDDKEIRKYVKQLLISEYIIVEADDTEAGFRFILESEPDIIVCDVIMRGTSGVEFCSKIKESPTFGHIPVILLTGSSSPEIKLKGIECGADDYITKPFESELLVARIKSLLKGRDTLKDYFFSEITLQNNSLKIPAEYSDFLAKCIKIVEAHLEDDDFSIKVFTDEIGMSRSKLFRKIKSISGLSNTEFIRYIRLRKAAELMIQTDLQIKEIAFQIGFQDMKYFREQFNKLFQMNPSDFVKKYRNNFNKNFSLNSTLVNHKSK